MPRLSTFMAPFVQIFHGQVDGQHAKTYVCGLLSDVERKNIASIAYRCGQSRLTAAVPETPLEEFARVAKAEHRIEACLQRSKSKAGLADYEVRNWTGWQQHQTLPLLATWFLVRETERGKKWTPAMTFPQIRQGFAMILRETFQCNTTAYMLKECQQRLQRNVLARFYHWRQRNRLAPLNLYKRQF